MMSQRPVFRVLLCGDRNWTNRPAIFCRLQRLSDQFPREAWSVVVVHGAAPGADTIADDVARIVGFRVEAYPADWAEYGKAAGPIRNRQMLDTVPNLVIAFHADLSASKGTKDCVFEANRRGITVEVIAG